MALGPEPTPSGRPTKARPAARARVVATVGSVGALVGITAGIALNAASSDADTGTSAPNAQGPSTTVGPGRPGDGWTLPDDRSGGEDRRAGDLDGDGRVGDPGDRRGRDHDDDWWEESGSDDDWRAPAPQQLPQEQVPQQQDGGWSPSAPQQSPQTRSSGS